MPTIAAEIETENPWLARGQRTLERYRETLLRQVAAKLIRPRTLWQPAELIEKMVAALADPVSLDRTLKPLPIESRQLLRLIAVSGQPSWPIQSLAELLHALGHVDGIQGVIELLETGTMFPELEGTLPVESFEAWLAPLASVPRSVFVVPLAAERCRAEPIDIVLPEPESKPKLAAREADGLEILLRLAVLWQMVRSAPLRQTQAGGFFKRDLDRLGSHPLLSAAAPDSPRPIADIAILTVELGRALGVVKVEDEQLVAGQLPESWSLGLGPAIAEVWSALFAIDGWDPALGFEPSARNWLRPAGAMVSIALQAIPLGQWITVANLATWFSNWHPDWSKHLERTSAWVEAYVLGLLHSLRIVEAAEEQGAWYVRLSALGRHVIAKTEAPALPNMPAQTLLVQPNLEMILYRQGLTPSLAGSLSRFAEWKGLGLACTLGLTSESVYQGLESGLSLIEVQRILERHSTRPLSDSVVETLRSWASKRERVQVYPSAVLLEFRTAAELEQAIKQGLVELKLTERIGLVSSESQIDYSRFRLVGTRDYQAPEERCVEVASDGLSLTSNDGRADLLFGTEVRRIADPIEPASEERSRFRMSLDSLRRARAGGVDMRWLDDWFIRRTGMPLPATARMLFLGRDVPAFSLQPITILRAPTKDIADGIEAWPAAATLVVERLGPTTFAVATEHVGELESLLKSAELQCNVVT